jgi:hypothetical protein
MLRCGSATASGPMLSRGLSMASAHKEPRARKLAPSEVDAANRCAARLAAHTASVRYVRLIGYACRHPDPPLRRAFLPLDRLTVMLGRNDAGKSTLLRAIQRDLSGGHYRDDDEEIVKKVGGVFFALASDAELSDLITSAENLRRRARDRRESFFGRRPPWGLRAWTLEHFENVELEAGSPIDLWLEQLRANAPDTPGFDDVLKALGGSRLIALEPAGLDEDGRRVWNVTWCLPTFDTLDKSLQQALKESDLLPFVADRERAAAKAEGRSYGWFTRGFFIPFHGNPSHLWAEEAPVVVAPIGQTHTAHLPRGLAVPTDFGALRSEVRQSLNDLVIAARFAQDDARHEDPLTAEEQALRSSPRNWLMTDDDGSRIHPDAWGAAAFIAAAANRLVPRFVAERYRLVVVLRSLEEWLSPDAQPLDLRLRMAQPDGRLEEFPIERVADGLRLWVQLALLEACEQAARVAGILRDLGGEWWVHAEQASHHYSDGGEDEGEEQDRQADYYAEQSAAILEDIRQLDPETKPWVGRILAEPLEQPDPENWTWRLARHRRFFLVDEPERHLHPNLQREAAVWLRDTIRARETPCLVATHSTPFLALPTDADMPLYVYVWRDRDDATCEPFDAGELRPLDRIATSLGFDRGELLTTISLFQVEGIHDVVVFDRIFGELRAARIALVPMEGLSNYQAVLDSDVLWRYTTAQVALTTDKFEPEILKNVLGNPKAARELRRSQSADDELKILAKLIGIAERNGKQIHLLGHRGADLIDVLDETTVCAEFAGYPGHVEAQKRWDAAVASGAKSADKKRFYEAEFGLPMDVNSYIRLADAHAVAGVKPPALEAIVEAAAALARGEPSGVLTTGGSN